MNAVTETNFRELYPSKVRDIYWQRVAWVLTEVLSVPPTLARDYRQILERAPIKQQIIAFHDQPLTVAMDLAEVERLTEQQLAKYRREMRTWAALDSALLAEAHTMQLGPTSAMLISIYAGAVRSILKILQRLFKVAD
jgi:hypothetical protein